MTHSSTPVLLTLGLALTLSLALSSCAGPDEVTSLTAQAALSGKPSADAGVPSPTPPTAATDVVDVSKCFTNATATGFGELLINAKSSDSSARLFARRPDGSLIGEVQNGGGSRYGGTVMPVQPYDPVTVTVTSTTGGSLTVPTTPFQI